MSADILVTERVEQDDYAPDSREEAVFTTDQLTSRAERLRTQAAWLDTVASRAEELTHQLEPTWDNLSTRIELKDHGSTAFIRVRGAEAFA